MNVLHLKYAVEVAKTKSISKAAENLYMGQPNLSRAIKELEMKLGVTIFARTKQGMVTTPEGERFLEYARKIVTQVDELECMYENRETLHKLSVCVAVGVCVDNIVAKLMEGEKAISDMVVCRKGTNYEVLSAVSGREVNLGIVQYDMAEKMDYEVLFAENGLSYKQLASGVTYQIAENNGSSIFASHTKREAVLVWREGYSFSAIDERFLDLI